MKKLLILDFYRKKPSKTISKNCMEIDLNDLEAYGDYEEHKEFARVSYKNVNDRTIVDWFSYDNESAWWLIYPTIYSRFNEAALFVDRFLAFLEKNNIETIRLHDNFEKLSIISQICKIKNIKLEINKKHFISFKIFQYLLNKIKPIIYKRITINKCKKRLKCYFKIKPVSLPSHSSVVITSPGIYRREMFDYRINQNTKQEFVLQPFLDLLYAKKIPTICLDLDYTFHGEITPLIERLKTEQHWFPIEIFLREPKSNKVKNYLKSLRKSYENFKRQNLKEIFVYKEILLWDFIESKFDEVFLEPHLPTYLHLGEKIEKFFKTTKPQSIVQIYETGPYAKSLEIAAKKIGIKTIGLQHGIIYEGNPDYPQKNIDFEQTRFPRSIPDLTLVFGHYYKKILNEKCGFPENKIKIMGNPIFYDIDKIKQKLTREKLLKKYGLQDKKIIFVPLSFRLSHQNQNNPDNILLEELFKNIKDHDDYIVLLRPHPGDMYDIDTVIEQKYGKKNFCSSKGSLFEDIVISDVIVTTISTVSVDATIFEKPILLVNIAGSATQSLGGIHKEMIEKEVSVSVSLSELFPKIQSIKKGELWKIENSQNREKFMQSFFNYKVEIDLLKLIYENPNTENI